MSETVTMSDKDTRCPTCGSDGVKACVDAQGRDLDHDHDGRPPFFPAGFDRIWREGNPS